jgi:hypothetical protein
MSMNIKDFEQKSSPKYTPEEGIQPAVVVQVIGLGLQEGQEWPPKSGKKKPDHYRVRVTYELVDEVHDFDGEQKPLIVSEEFKISNDDRSTCFKRLNAIDPGMKKTQGDLMKLVGAPVALSIQINDRGYPKITAAAKPSKSMTIDTDTFNEKLTYNPDDHDQDVFESLPDFIQQKIQSRLDAKGETAPKESESSEPEFNDPLPGDEDDTDGEW